MDDQLNGFFDGVEWRDGLPTKSTNQSCAFCAAEQPQWIHPLDPRLVQYRVYGKGHTLPTFWTVCTRCENLYQRGLDDDLIEVMTSGPLEWSWVQSTDIAECVAQPLSVFRRADLGARKLPS
jgi:hypothetical protein